MECEDNAGNGNHVYKGDLKRVDDCAAACFGISSIFQYGTNLYGNNRCGNKGVPGCSCYCDKNSLEGVCIKAIEHTGYNTYQYSSKCRFL